MIEIEKGKERALIVGCFKKGKNREFELDNLKEMAFLAETAGAEVVDIIYQEVEKKSVVTLIGKGKVEEIIELIEIEKIDIVVFDDELSPVQIRNLEKSLNKKVLDRSGVILDIFASRAKTKQAKTQVELAQLQYLLPRLTRMWTHLSKQFGGIGTKGPGETQIETDRRLLRNRIEHLKQMLSQISKQNEQKRKGQSKMPRFGLVGYTNAGKSTLMKALTNEDVYIEDKLFATLDTTTRKFTLPLGQDVLLSDTVGFIRKLPAHLVASFESTLAEAKEADFLLHIVDVSNKYFREHIKIVNDTLLKLKIEIEDIILVFNKIDRLEDSDEVAMIKEEFPNSIFISAYKNTNIERLLNLLQNKYNQLSSDFKVMLPYIETKNLNIIYELGEVILRNDNDEGYDLRVRVQSENVGKFSSMFEKYILS
jgi:GTP-binding protein HflX